MAAKEEDKPKSPGVKSTLTSTLVLKSGKTVKVHKHVLAENKAMLGEAKTNQVELIWATRLL